MYNQDLLILKIKKAQGDNSLNDFAKLSKVDSGYLSRIINKKKTNPPSPEVLKKIADASHGICSYEELMQICGYLDLKRSAFYDFSSIDIQNLIDDLVDYIKDNNIKNFKINSTINERVDNALLNEQSLNRYVPTKKQIFEELKSSLKNLDSDKTNIINVYSSVHAGILSEMIEDIVDTEEIDSNMFKGGKEYFGVKVKGDSMSPKYIEGDTIIVEKTSNCENGQDCIVAVNGNEAFLKRVFKSETGIMLQALNPNYEPLIYTNKEISNIPITIIGVVRELRRKI